MEDQQNMEPGGGSSSSSSSDDSSGNSGNDSDSEVGSITGGGTTLGGMSSLAISNAATSDAGGVALAFPTPSQTSTVTPPHLRKGPPSVKSGNSNFAKVPTVKRPVNMDAARRVRELEEEQKLDDDVEVASSASESD